MMGKVQELEDDKQKLSVQIQVLTRELRSMSERLEIMNSKCVCRAKHLVASSAATDGGREIYHISDFGTADFLSNSRLNLPIQHQLHRPSSQHSMH